ncbi:hypothetical protein [Embleya sp. NPDC001921]
MNINDLAQREAVLKALHDAIGDELKAVKAETQTALDTTNKGVQQVAATLPDGTKVGTVSLTDPKPEARVTDPAAFLEWVRENYKTEIERRMVTEVRAAFITKILAEITAADTPQIVDSETGEIHKVPGVEIKATRSRTHSVRLSAEGRAAIGAAWQAGELAHLVLPAIGGAE